jgi:L-threonylcarbamoyladenylate synthase
MQKVGILSLIERSERIKTVPLRLEHKSTARMSITEHIEQLCDTLSSGGTILYPTDTIWALGCDATSEEAVQKILQLKRQNPGLGLVCLVNSLEQLKTLVAEVPVKIENLLIYHKRPLTVIYDRGIGLAPSALHKNGSIAIRVVTDPFVNELIDLTGKPLIATIPAYGKQAPTCFGEISTDFLQHVDRVAFYKQDDKFTGELSVMVRLGDGEELELVRE